MRAASPAAMLFGAFILALTIELLRRRSLREKYAALWLAISVAVVVFAIFPGTLVGTARLLGFAVPANLLFFGGGVVLTIISMQLSLETGRLEDESQRLAEEVALLRLEVRRLGTQLNDLRSAVSSPPPATPPASQPAPEPDGSANGITAKPSEAKDLQRHPAGRDR